MLKSHNPVLVAILALCLGAVVSGWHPAVAQDFTIQASPMNPASVDPGGTSISTVTVGTVNSVSGANVALSCAVTSGPTTAPPTCIVSPTSVSTPASATMTVTAGGTTLPGLYTLTVTGTDASGTLSTTTTLNVVAVVPQYTLSVTTTISPTSVHAGNGATAVVSIVPADGYTGTVTLACSKVTPAVTLSPTCTFAFGNLAQPPAVPVTTSAAVPVTLTINTTGPPPTTTPAAIPHRVGFYGLWLPLAGFALLAGVGSRHGRARRFLGLFLLFALAAGVLFLPACGNSSTSTTTNPSGNTPNNTYTFTLTATDVNSQAPSNATDITVALTVN